MGRAGNGSSFILMISLLALVAAVAGAGRHLAAADIDASRVGICASAVAIHGYKCQEFDVKTDDGYILNLQRIPQGVAADNSTNRPPVLLQHGVLVDGVTWLLNSPKESLALILADSGFDVWIANVRGTRFSRRHVSLDPNKPEFWNWTWDDLVVHDLPAVIGFVHQQTGQKIHYVGHSMGTLIALATFSEGKQIDKVKSAALLSPIAYLSHMNTALGVVAAKAFVGEITSIFGLAEFNPKGEAVAGLMKFFCAQPGVDCYDLLTAVTGTYPIIHLIFTIIVIVNSLMIINFKWIDKHHDL
ncbi:OLC1v1011813C1 [Oldenlandia corymbosa var. corymbosa]|uniref:OLC1v1011813C1 n=1 Tax=Oldenlandia corymbosa var. corymbosa TaxID=529605 RepID=A0AAV1DWW6_OLDCO|nr:OLC1v1011813C1 [Oldenlandia corymbosa var. corymbosa]